MTIALHAWMIVPGLLTVLALLALIYQACTRALFRDDVGIIATIWAVLMTVSLLSIWSAS